MIKEPEQDDILSLYNEDLEKKDNKKLKKNEDLTNIIFLTFLYVIQAIPIGVAFSIPLILSSRRVSYADQGTYSFAVWPFSMKLLWAPLVDAFFIKKIGRRKTWIVLCKFLSGLVMVSFASFLNHLIDPETEKNKSDIYLLTLIFGLLVFLGSTNDIALDAWSLDLLMEKNASFQVLCNSLGMGFGQFIGNSGFLIFESKDFSNRYIRPFFKLPPQKHGIVTIEKLFYVLGTISILVSLIILIFKNEYNPKKMKIESERLLVEKNEKEIKNRSILDTFKIIWKILLIKPVRLLIIVMTTYRIAFSTESVIRLKLVEEGFSKEKLSLLGILMSPLLTVLPFFLAKLLKGPRPLNYFRRGVGLKIIAVIIFSIFVYFIPKFRNDDRSFSLLFYILLFTISLISGLFSITAIVSLGGFNAKISDRLVGGTYMTFLAFWPNLGSNISRTGALYLINLLTFKKCDLNSSNNNSTFVFNNISNQTNISFSSNHTLLLDYSNKCSNEIEVKDCLKYGGKCVTLFDSFYPITACFLLIGVFWFIFTRNAIKKLQTLPKSAWLLDQSEN